MNGPTEQFPFVEVDPVLGPASRMPYIPVVLNRGSHSVKTEALIDTGAALNVLPHTLGLRLGAVWDQLNLRLQLTGNLASIEARFLAVDIHVGGLPPAWLGFAWTAADGHPVILGEVNFLDEFDVCFYRARSIVEIQRAVTGSGSP